MNDDRALRDRLANLAAAVPVPPPSPASTLTRRPVTLGPALRTPVSRSWLPVALVAVLVVAAVGILASGSQPSYGPVVETVRQGDFELTLRSEKGRYEPDEPIQIEASLAYVGPEPSIKIGHGFGADASAVSFGIVEPVIGDLRLQPDWEAICAPSTLTRDGPVRVPFQKSGGWDGSGPRGNEQGPFMLDPVLRLEAGTWHVFAEAWFSVGGCDPPDYRLRAEIAITVGSPSPSPTEPPAPTELANPAQSVTVRDGDFELTIRSSKTRYATDEAVDVTASLVYRGPEPAVGISGGLGQIWSRERSGEIVVGFEGPLIMICPGGTYVQGVPHEVSIVTVRQTADRFEPQPIPLLPAGTWHLYAVAGTCGGPPPGAIQFELEAEITIEVEAAAPAPTEIANPSQSATDRDGDFELTLRSDKTRYGPDEPIDLTTTLTYVGTEDSVEIWHDSVGALDVGIREPIHGMELRHISLLTCDRSTLRRDIPLSAQGVAGVVFVPDDPAAESVRALLGPPVRLPIGVWHVYASAQTSCMDQGPRTELSVEITIVVSDDALATPDGGPPVSPTASVTPTEDPTNVAVTASAERDGFRLTLMAPHQRYRSGDAIQAEILLENVGHEEAPFLLASSPLVALSTSEAKGELTASFDSGGGCGPFGYYERGQPTRLEFRMLSNYAVDVSDEWLRRFVEGPTFTLPSGTWTLSARTVLFPPECDATRAPIELQAEVVVVVEP